MEPSRSGENETSHRVQTSRLSGSVSLRWVDPAQGVGINDILRIQEIGADANQLDHNLADRFPAPLPPLLPTDQQMPDANSLTVPSATDKLKTPVLPVILPKEAPNIPNAIHDPQSAPAATKFPPRLPLRTEKTAGPVHRSPGKRIKFSDGVQQAAKRARSASTGIRRRFVMADDEREQRRAFNFGRDQQKDTASRSKSSRTKRATSQEAEDGHV